MMVGLFSLLIASFVSGNGFRLRITPTAAQEDGQRKKSVALDDDDDDDDGLVG